MKQLLTDILVFLFIFFFFFVSIDEKLKLFVKKTTNEIKQKYSTKKKKKNGSLTERQRFEYVPLFLTQTLSKYNCLIRGRITKLFAVYDCTFLKKNVGVV